MLTLALIACTDDPSETTGEDETGTPVAISAVEVDWLDSADPYEDLFELTATSGGFEVSDVVESWNCCVDIAPAGTIEDSAITIEYADPGDTALCDCICAHAVRFAVSGLDAGSYTVAVPGDEGSVTVE